MEQTSLKALGERVLFCRSRKDFSRKDLALISGVTTETVRKLEDGEDVGMESILRICKGLNCSADYLFFGILGKQEEEGLQKRFYRLALKDEEVLRNMFRLLWETSPKSIERI